MAESVVAFSNTTSIVVDGRERVAMRELRHSVEVHAPGSFTRAFIATFLLEHGPRNEARLALRFPLPDLFVRGLTLEKTVVLELCSGAESAASPLQIGWRPIHDEAVPAFHGTLTAEPPDAERCLVTLAGSYTPPGGALGAMFDALAGVHIARATLAALLTQFAAGAEADYRMRLSP